MRYLILIYIYIKKRYQFTVLDIEREANLAVFKNDIERDNSKDTKRIIELEAKNQSERTPDEEIELARLEDEVGRSERLKKVKEKMTGEMARTENVINALRDKVLRRD